MERIRRALWGRILQVILIFWVEHVPHTNCGQILRQTSNAKVKMRTTYTRSPSSSWRASRIPDRNRRRQWPASVAPHTLLCPSYKRRLRPWNEIGFISEMHQVLDLHLILLVPSPCNRSNLRHSGTYRRPCAGMFRSFPHSRRPRPEEIYY